MQKLVSKSYVYDPRPNYPFLITAKRYWIPDVSYDDDALTLIFAHGTGFHKEHWEPTIDDLQELLLSRGGVKVREFWSIDAPNHGDAAILNENTLSWGYENIFQWEDYARSIHSFLSGFGTGVDVDFKSRNLVGIGHSMGAVSLMLTVGYYPQIKFHSVIFCELMCMSREYTAPAGNMLSSGAEKRRDTWPSKEEAYKTMKSRGVWSTWDDRVLRLFIECGLRGLPTLDYPSKTVGVTLKCSRAQEAACYRDGLGLTRGYRLLGSYVRTVPTHLIYGAIDDYLPAAVKMDIIDNVVWGVENLASFSRVEGAGHLVVQVNPRGLAQKIYDALNTPLAGDRKSVV